MTKHLRAEKSRQQNNMDGERGIPVNARLVATVAVELAGEFTLGFPSIQIGHAVEVNIRNLQEYLVWRDVAPYI